MVSKNEQEIVLKTSTNIMNVEVFNNYETLRMNGIEAIE